MNEDYTKFPVDQKLMPIIFAPAIRLSSEFADAWDLPDSVSLDDAADELYFSEWQVGGKKQHEYVGEAAVKAGLGNYSAAMRTWGARVAANIIMDSSKPTNVIDIGAGDGSSAEDVYKIVRNPGRLFMTMIEPSGKKCQLIDDKMKNRGLTRDSDYSIINARDIDALDYLDTDSQDLALQVAAVHHHRSRKKSFGCASTFVKKGGIYVSVDWHSRLWMAPAVVYNYLLREMKWPEKERCMAVFVDAYPGAKDALPRFGHYSLEELKVFSRYWQAWNEKRQEMIADGSFDYSDDFFAMEGHCPIEVYIRELKEAGFEQDTPRIIKLVDDGVIKANPEQIIPNHNLAQGLVSQNMKAA